MEINSSFLCINNPVDLLHGQCTNSCGYPELSPMFGKLPNRRHTPDCLLCAGFVVTSKGKQCLQIVWGFKQVNIGLMSAALEIALDSWTNLTSKKPRISFNTLLSRRVNFHLKRSWTSRSVKGSSTTKAPQVSTQIATGKVLPSSSLFFSVGNLVSKQYLPIVPQVFYYAHTAIWPWFGRMSAERLAKLSLQTKLTFLLCCLAIRLATLRWWHQGDSGWGPSKGHTCSEPQPTYPVLSVPFLAHGRSILPSQAWEYENKENLNCATSQCYGKKLQTI